MILLNNSVFWTTKDETPMRISPSPDSEDRGSWPKDTELYGLCWRFIPDIQDGFEQQTVTHYMRSSEDGRRGWVIAFYDRPSLVPPRGQNHSFLSREAENSFFQNQSNDIETRRQAVLKELSDD